MKEELKIQIIFEEYNSKYNRIWEQLTNLGIFVLSAVVGYVIAIGSIEKNVGMILTIERVNDVPIFIVLFLGIGVMILVTHLILTRNDMKRLFRDCDLRF